ncbi:MAG: nickel pincer cofactor biosynthesis protein LarC [Candidatus Lokiarchaeota archaeon]|nr:nickel pincer cofactor biosynthesis protein LarC [Candidatus Lokiarchaeota archaeon]
MKIIVIDGSICGISGDMVLSALIDLGGDKEKISNLANYLKENFDEIKDLSVEIKKINKSGINSTFLEIEIEEINSYRGSEKLINILDETLEAQGVSDKSKELARKILKKILKAESAVHNEIINNIHLHETGSFDTILDIVGTVLLCEDLDIIEDTTWFGLPLAVGGGTINFSHGTFSVPAPATMNILKNANYKIRGGPVNEELATPTGVAILTTLVEKQSDFIPEMNLKRIGRGSGVKNFDSVANILRILYGDSNKKVGKWEYISQIETNIDDIPGEIIGNLIDKMEISGKIKDINVISNITKKNRPGYIIKILSDISNEKENIDFLIRETGTLGVRVSRIRRKILNRKIIKKKIKISDGTFEISIKVAWDKSGLINYKPEFDEVKKIAEKLQLPTRVILKKIISRIDENDLLQNSG